MGSSVMETIMEEASGLAALATISGAAAGNSPNAEGLVAFGALGMAACVLRGGNLGL
jgi:hypothetical protein